MNLGGLCSQVGIKGMRHGHAADGPCERPERETVCDSGMIQGMRQRYVVRFAVAPPTLGLWDLRHRVGPTGAGQAGVLNIVSKLTARPSVAVDMPSRNGACSGTGAIPLQRIA